MNKQVETTVLIELFSTFYEKIILNHPQKDFLMKELSKFKSYLYLNQDNMDSCFEFLKSLSSNLQSQFQCISQPQPSGPQSKLDSHLIAASSNAVRQQPQKQPLQQPQPTAQLSQQQLLPAQTPLTLQSLAKNYSIDLSSSMQFLGQSQVRELPEDAHNPYRCIIYSYLEKLMEDKNETKLMQMVDLVNSDQLTLKDPTPKQTENELQLNSASLKKQFCTTMKRLVGPSLQQSSQQSIKDLYQYAQTDQLFDLSVISFIKEYIVKYLRQSDPKYIQYLTSNQSKDFTAEQIINQLVSSEFQEIFYKIIPSALELNIQIFILNSGGMIKQNIYKYHTNKPDKVIYTINLLQAQLSPDQKSNTYKIFYLNKESEQKIQSMVRDEKAPPIQKPSAKEPDCYICRQPLCVGSSTKLKCCNTQFDVQCLQTYISNKQRLKLTAKCPACFSLISQEEINGLAPTPVDPPMNSTEPHDLYIPQLKEKAQNLLKMFKIFESNTEELLKIISERNDDENKAKEFQTIDNILREQINENKSRMTNFYNNIQQNGDYQEKKSHEKWISDLGFNTNNFSTYGQSSKTIMVDDKMKGHMGNLVSEQQPIKINK